VPLLTLVLHFTVVPLVVTVLVQDVSFGFGCRLLRLTRWIVAIHVAFFTVPQVTIVHRYVYVVALLNVTLIAVCVAFVPFPFDYRSSLFRCLLMRSLFWSRFVRCCIVIVIVIDDCHCYLMLLQYSIIIGIIDIRYY